MDDVKGVKNPVRDKLAEQVKANELKIQDHVKMTLELARDSGEKLNDLYELIPHGQWQSWLKKEFKGHPSYQSVTHYRKIADYWEHPEVVKAREELNINTIEGILAVIREIENPTLNEFAGVLPKDMAEHLALKKWKEEMSKRASEVFAKRFKQLSFEELYILQSEDRKDNTCEHDLWYSFRELVQEATRKEIGILKDDPQAEQKRQAWLEAKRKKREEQLASITA